MKAALAATALLALSTAPAMAQTWSSYGQGQGQGYYGQGSYGQSYGGQGSYGSGSRSWSSRGSGYNDFNGQQDRPGDYRCDAYWDRGRDDCDASWRDQRSYRGSYGGYRSSYRGGNAQGGGYVYQPYNQGTQYYGAYGRPDQVYPGSGYGGQVGGYGQGGYGQNRDPNRSAWCASQYRSYDANSGFYRAYSGRLIFCG